jgi:hypothetical protein
VFVCLFVCLFGVRCCFFFFSSATNSVWRRQGGGRTRTTRCRRIFFNLRDPLPHLPFFFPLQVREKICSDLFFFLLLLLLCQHCYRYAIQGEREIERERYIYRERTLSVSGRRASFLRRKKKSKSKGISIDVREKN